MMRLSREPMPRVLKKDIIERIIGGQLTNLEKTITDDATDLMNTAIALKAANAQLIEKEPLEETKPGLFRRLVNKFTQKDEVNNTSNTNSTKPNLNKQPFTKSPEISPQDKIAATKLAKEADKIADQQVKDSKTQEILSQTNNSNVLIKIFQLTAQTFGPIQLALIFIALLALYAGFIVSIYYFIITIQKIRARFSIDDPLNTETIDWEIVKSFSKYKGSFNFLIFLILPAISILCIILVFVLLPIFPTKINMPGEVKLLIAGIAMVAFLILLLQFIISMLLSSQIKAIGDKLVKLNKEIYSRFTTKVGVLTHLKEIRDSGFDIEEEVIKHGLSYINDLSSKEDIAKIFYTITLFIYYHNLLGTRDTNLYESLKIFTISNLLLQLLSPSDFFPKYGTYIPLQDITFENNLINYFKDVYNKNAATITDGLQLYRNWISELNLDANSIYPGKATVTYYILWILTFIIHSIPVLILLGILFGIGVNSPVGKIFTFLKSKLI